MNTFIQQGCIQLIKGDHEDIYTLTKFLNKCCTLHKNIKQDNCF